MTDTKTEKGFVLLVVLLTIVIVSIFSIPILTNIMSSALMFEKTEENFQLKKLQEMGFEYVEAVNNKVTTEARNYCWSLYERHEEAQGYEVERCVDEQIDIRLAPYKQKEIILDDEQRYRFQIDFEKINGDIVFTVISFFDGESETVTIE